jgi:urocanate hydratase
MRRPPRKADGGEPRLHRPHVRAMLDFQKRGAVVFDNGNLIRTQAREAASKNAFDIPIFTEAYLRPLFARAIGPFRWMALVGRSRRHRRIDDLVLRTVRRQRHRHQLDQAGARKRAVRGAAGADRLARPWRAQRTGARRQRAGRQPDALRADRLLARSSRCRRHGASQHHDRKHARRVGCHRRLAAARRHGAVFASGADLVTVHSGGGGYAGYMTSRRRDADRRRHARRWRAALASPHQRHLASACDALCRCIAISIPYRLDAVFDRFLLILNSC